MDIRRKVLLDSSFIISCVRKKIDFVSRLEELGFSVVVPEEVLEEMEKLKNKKGFSQEDKIAINLAFALIERRNLSTISLDERNVDLGLIKKGNEGFFIATLDREIKKLIPKRIVIFDSKKDVGEER